MSLVQSDIVQKLQSAMEAEVEPLDIPPFNLFAPGLYCRMLTMPAGTVWISKIHKTEHICVALTGRATVVSGARGREEIIAPRVMVTKPGTQRALYIHEESTWATFHPTDKTDVAEIEEDIIAKDFDDPDLIPYLANYLQGESA